MIVLVRHGSTQANERGLLQGSRLDPGLSAIGFAQADAAANTLANSDERTIVVSSPLKRARQTASIISRLLDCQLELDESFIEMDYGDWDGRPLSEIPAAVWKQWRDEPGFAPPDGESLDALQDRVIDGLIARGLDDRRVIIVSHVSPIKAAVAGVLGAPAQSAWNMYLSTGSITTIRRRAEAQPTRHALGYTLLEFNSTAHLSDLVAQ